MNLTTQSKLRTALSVMTAALLTGTSAFSQHLNNTQQGSLWAPAGVRIDANAKEWGSDFQAYNSTTDVFYSMANDENNLYLVVKSTNQMINNKIMAGGITLTLNTSGKKKEKDGFALTFPMVDLAKLRGQVMSRMRGPGGPQGLDSAAIAGMRKQAIAAAKEIKLDGFKDIPDSVISIYNEFGIKAAIDYDRNGNLICEMALPLKLINADVAKTKELGYNIKLNGLNLSAMFQTRVDGPGGMGGPPPPMPGGGNITIVRADGGGGMGMMPGGGMGGEGFRMPRGMPSMQDMQNMVSPTDFWAKYPLAKKAN